MDRGKTPHEINAATVRPRAADVRPINIVVPVRRSSNLFSRCSIRFSRFSSSGLRPSRSVFFFEFPRLGAIELFFLELWRADLCVLGLCTVFSRHSYIIDSFSIRYTPR